MSLLLILVLFSQEICPFPHCIAFAHLGCVQTAAFSAPIRFFFLSCHLFHVCVPISLRTWPKSDTNVNCKLVLKWPAHVKAHKQILSLEQSCCPSYVFCGCKQMFKLILKQRRQTWVAKNTLASLALVSAFSVDKGTWVCMIMMKWNVALVIGTATYEPRTYFRVPCGF